MVHIKFFSSLTHIALIINFDFVFYCVAYQHQYLFTYTHIDQWVHVFLFEYYIIVLLASSFGGELPIWIKHFISLLHPCLILHVLLLEIWKVSLICYSIMIFMLLDKAEKNSLLIYLIWVYLFYFIIVISLWINFIRAQFSISSLKIYHKSHIYCFYYS